MELKITNECDLMSTNEVLSCPFVIGRTTLFDQILDFIVWD